MAWLHAVPKPPEGSKRAKRNQAAELSRLELMKADGVPPQLPPNPMPHLTSWLQELGWIEAAGMGAATLSWQAIQAWKTLTAIDLSPWDARTLRVLSAEYLAESRKADAETCPSPFRGEVTKREQELERARLEDILG